MDEPITIIGAGTVITGNIEGDDDLTIEGRVEGTIVISKTLTIEESGVVHANINVCNTLISGVLVGNIEAEDTVQVTESGRVMGDIRAQRVILIDGASFRGNIDMGEFDVDSEAKQIATNVRPSSVLPDQSEKKRYPRETAVSVRPWTQQISAPKPSSVRPSAVTSAGLETKPVPLRMAPAPKVRSVGRSKAERKKS